MLTAEAWAVRNAIGIPAKVAYWSEVFEGNPNVSRTEGFPLQNRPGHRPYHLGAVRTQHGNKAIYNPNFRAVPGELYGVTPRLHGKIVIEPNFKPDFFADNKDWGWERYQALVETVGPGEFLQLGAPGVRRLTGVEQVKTAFFRAALDWLAGARLFVGGDGGLHHAAAAMRLPAVVIFGGLVHPRTLGYDFHINLASEDAGCGHMFPCQHCRKAMEAITVEQVAAAIREISCR